MDTFPTSPEHNSPPLPSPHTNGVATPPTTTSASAPAVLAPPVHVNGQSTSSDSYANGHVYGQAQARAAGDSLPNLGDMEARCGGCKDMIDQENGGVVVAFGTALWHVDCFRCAKCKDRVSADTNLLLLSDGSPVCGNCSYQCFVCKQAITEEAIMTGDESYHAHCFTCRTCKRRIDELVFAKTSQGIYCMSCHNDRIARSRRHAEAKRQRAARKEKEREKELQKNKDKLSDGPAIPEEAGQDDPSRPSRSILDQVPSVSETETNSPTLAAQSYASSPLISPSTTPNALTTTRLPETGTGSPVLGLDLSDTHDGTRTRDISLANLNTRTASPAGARIAEKVPLPASPSESTTQFRTRPLNPGSPSAVMTPTLGAGSPGNSSSTLRINQNQGLGVGPVGLSVPTTRADKRRSINPGMTFSLDLQNSTFAAEPRLSPLPSSPLRSSFTDLAAQAPKSPRSPASPSPTGGPAYPFPQPHPVAPPTTSTTGEDKESDREESGQPPPRTSSLREQLGTSEKFASTVEDVDRVTAPHTNGQQTPRLAAPELVPLTLSLSDPDFQVILNQMDQPSPDKESKPNGSSTLGLQTQSTPTITASPPTAIESMSRSQSGNLARSPNMDMLSSAFAEETSGSGSGAGPSRSRSPNRSQLSTPQILKTRQASAESTTSVSSRLGTDSAFQAIVELIASAKHGNQDAVQVDLSVLTAIISEAEDLKEMVVNLQNKYTGYKRSSQQYSEGLTVAGEEYDKELAMRRELEAEVTRLRAQVHAQTARLSVISGDERRQETMRRRSHDLASSLTGLERDISKLRAQRDMTLAEVEELNARRSLDGSVEDAANAVTQSLTSRMDTIKEQYRGELEPLTAQREALQREILDLRESREQFLEESTALAAKNEELAELNAQLGRQNEMLQDSVARARAPTIFAKRHPTGSPSLSSLTTSATLQEVPEETARVVKVTKPEPQAIEAAPAKRFKWLGKSSKGPDMSNVSASISRPLALPTDRKANLMQRPSTEFGTRDHNFQQHSTMRFTRCELCQEKMWGIQEVRCTFCGSIFHAKCSEKLPKHCPGVKMGVPEIQDGPSPPSMFGRDLSEQVIADKTLVPVIVTKSISAVEAVGMEYEGIYRKTGGSSQSKQITQLFERGDYEAFDLSDLDVFNDISSVTSVLKTYFRSLPNPLLTHTLHESFVAAASIRDSGNKHSALCALLKELPTEHYNTLRVLMLHLHRVTQHASVNLMTSQNLGVVFGPTLLRSHDPQREFGDMAGKAMSVQWMVENAPSVFAETQEGGS